MNSFPSRITLVCCLLIPVWLEAEPTLTAEWDTELLATRFALADGEGSSIYRLESSSDLAAWWPRFAAGGPAWDYVDDASVTTAGRFFRARGAPPPFVTGHETWRPSISFPDDPFESPPMAGSSLFTPGAIDLTFVKFTIFHDDLTTVYFQDSSSYAFHYTFAVDRLDPFAGASSTEFNLRTLFHDGQEAILGSVIFAAEADEYGIEFVGEDRFPRELIRYLFEVVESAIVRPASSRGFYLPVYTQAMESEAAKTYFAERGIAVDSLLRWQSGDSVYNEGWAVGRLVYLQTDEIDAAYANSELRPEDILLTDKVPAELPFVRGIITLSPAGGSSHVAILARASGVPFAYVSDPVMVEAALGLDGVETLFAVSIRNPEPIEIRSFPGDFPENLRDDLFSRKAVAELSIQPIEILGAYSAPTDLLAPDDIKYFGGKAANFGALRRAIPDNSPASIAFSFDLWTEFLDQEIGGLPLRTHIQNKLGAYAWPVGHLAALQADLNFVRDLIKDETAFSPEQTSAVIAALEPFDDDRKIRFRSSTNVEDSAFFVGAGLYDSYSGCLLDDLDGDDLGPSQCDSSKENERGVFRALRRVYASFYNNNAFLERLRYGVDESQVGMAVLVHHSFPDEEEMANGVATGGLDLRWSNETLEVDISTQVGAESVTNPEGGAIPEVVGSYRSKHGSYLYFHQRSNLLQLGEDTVMEWETDYKALAELFHASALELASFSPEREQFELDFEFKKTAPDGRLVLKQIREIPVYDQGKGLPYLLDGSVVKEWRVFQGESGDVFGVHRLKSRWRIDLAHRRLDETGVAETLLEDLVWERIGESGEVFQSIGDPTTWSGFSHQSKFESGPAWAATDSWEAPHRDGGMTLFSLESRWPETVTRATNNPVRTAPSPYWWLSADYAEPVLFLDWDDEFKTRKSDYVILEEVPPSEIPEGATLQHRVASNFGESVSFDIRFWWPPDPGAAAGYTAPLLHWERSVITGLTTEPLMLSEFYAQTYGPAHHNFGENYLFEPALDPAVSAAQIAELEAAGIRLILLRIGFSPKPKVYTISPDGTVTVW